MKFLFKARARQIKIACKIEYEKSFCSLSRDFANF